MCDIVRDKNGVLIAIIDKKLVDERTLSMFENESDYVIEIEEIVERLKIRRGIRIKKNPKKPPSKFYELLINDRGIRLGKRID